MLNPRKKRNPYRVQQAFFDSKNDRRLPLALKELVFNCFNKNSNIETRDKNWIR